MAHNFQRPNLPYENDSLQNDNRYQLVTRSSQRPATDVMFDTDFNYLVDAVRALDNDIAGVGAGILPGSDNAANANLLPTTDGAGNISWIDISDINIRDHSISRLKLIPQTITATEIMDGTIVANKLAPNSVTSLQISDYSVTTNKLADGSVTSEKIDEDAVTDIELANNAVIASKIANGAVTTPKILDGNVTLPKLAQDVMDYINNLMNNLVPIGTVIDLPITVPVPAIYKECNGQLLNRVTYASLFAAIGTTNGAGDGSTTFAVPDRRGATSVGIGSDNSTGGKITAATASNITLGGTFGAETHTLTEPELASHSHNIPATDGALTGATRNTASNQIGDFETNPAGGDQPHNNVQPSIFTRYYIRAS